MGYYLKKHKVLFILTIFFGIIVALGSVYIAILLEGILNLAVSGDMSEFGRLVLFSAIYFIVLGVLMYIYSRLTYYFINTVVKALRERTFTGTMSRHYADFRKNSAADYLSALTNDVKIIEDNYLKPLLTLIESSVTFVAAVVVMFYFDIIIALCVIVSILSMFVIPGLFGGIIAKRQERFSNSLSGFTNHSKDMLSGYEVVKSYGIIDYIIKRFKESNKAVANAKFSVDKVMAISESISMLLGVFVQIGAMFLAAYFIIIGRISVGTLLGIVNATGMLVMPLSTIFQNAPMIQGASPIIKRINELSVRHEVNADAKSPSFGEKISADNLTFSYGGENNILNKTKLTIEKGAKYAIVGKSGCGKSTIAKLLCGYYFDYDGEIKYDGFELKELNYDGIVKLSSTIHQGVYIFNESIYDNICLHREYSAKQLQKALDLSGVSGFISQLPDGLNTIAAENGSNLSGGQKQRIAVARSIIEGKPFLVLDEGTSAIDMQTAYEIENNLLGIDELTLVTITHNLSEDNLKRYEKIIYMDKGIVEECGTYNELVEKQGGFYEFSRL